MKKFNFLILFIIFFITSCTTTKPLKVTELESDEFTVHYVSFESGTIQPTDEELVQIFKKFPYEQIFDMVWEQTGVYLDISLITNEEIENDMEYVILVDSETEEEIEELPQWFISMDTDNEQLAELYFKMNPPDGFLEVKVVMHTTKTIPAQKEGQKDKIFTLQTKCNWYWYDWTYKNIFVDPRSCAQVTFNKHIQPTFVNNELYAVYSIINSTDDGYLNIPANEEVEIRCNINDGGNAFFSPAQIYNASFVEKLQPGKKYVINYKLKRKSPDTSKWTVEFYLKEVKPKLTKN